MEPSHQTKQLTGRLLLVLCAVVLTAAAVRQFSSSFVQILTQDQNSTLRVAVLTKPAMLFTYNPATQQVLATVASGKCNTSHPHTCFDGNFDRYFIPSQSEQGPFWEDVKKTLLSWRFNPLLMARVAWVYISAAHDRRTDFSPAEFFLLTQEMATLNVNDFAIQYPRKTKNSKKAEPVKEIPEAAMIATQRTSGPLIVEIFNASGRKGLAQELTQYLREQNNKGLLRVDVWDYGNFPSVEDKSYIEDYSGRLMQAMQIARAIGITSEIKSVADSSSLCHSRIVLGKDFQMPL